MCPPHRFVVRGSDNDAHLIRKRSVFRIIIVKSISPHGRPDEISFQPENQFKHFFVKQMIKPSESGFRPSGQSRCFIVQENAAIFHGRLSGGKFSRFYEYFFRFSHRNIRPVIPGRNSHLTGKFINPVNGTPQIASCNDQSFFNSICRIFNSLNNEFFVFSFQIDFSNQLIDKLVFVVSTYNDFNRLIARIQYYRFFTGNHFYVILKMQNGILNSGILIFIH